MSNDRTVSADRVPSAPLRLLATLAGMTVVAAATGLSAVALSGCRQGTNTIEYRRGQDAPRNVEVDTKLSKLARVYDLSEFDRGGVLNVQARVENTTGRDQNVTYQWVWYEGDYELPQDTSITRTLNLEPRETKSIAGVAPNGNVDGYKLNINRARGD